MSPIQAPSNADRIDDDKLQAVDHVEDERETPTKPGGGGTYLDTYRSYSPELARETERQLLRKIDLRLMPLVVLIYLFNYLDRNSITQARLYNLQQDLGVQGATYQTAISIFSAGYIAMQIPSTIMMSKFQPHVFLVSDDDFLVVFFFFFFFLFFTCPPPEIACCALSRTIHKLLSLKLDVNLTKTVSSSPP